MRIDWHNCKYLDTTGLLDVVEKFGSHLKKLVIVNYIDQQNFNPHALMSILEYLPIIEDLEISGCHLTKIKSQAEKLKNSFKMNRLKKLCLVNCTHEVEDILNSISSDSLEKFNFHDYFYRYNELFFQKFLDRESNIKKLKILNCDKIKLDHLQLENLSIDPSRSTLPDICSQRSLRVLTHSGKVGDAELAALSHLRNLEKITIDITEVTAAGIGALKLFVELKTLKLSNFCTDSTSALGVLEDLRLPNLKRLSLEVNPLITKQDIVKLSQNFPRLKQLVVCDSIAFTLQEVFRSFPDIEKVSFHRMKNGWLSFGDGHKNLKEIELSHVGSCSASTWKSELSFLKKCPKLEKILISEVCNFQIEDLTALVECLPNLSHLVLDFKNFYIDCNGKAVKNAVPKDLSFFDAMLECFQTSEKLVFLKLSQLAMLPDVEQLQAAASLAFPSVKISVNNKLKQCLMQKRVSKSILQ